MLAGHKFATTMPPFSGCADRYCLSGYGGGGKNIEEWLDMAKSVDGLDSDGDIWKLIPVWMNNGINMLWPFEVQSKMDVNKVRQEFPELVIMGGINKKEIAKGGRDMQAEVDRVLPLIEKGGYIPELDHSIPPDISWPTYCYYIDYMKKKLG